MVRRAFSPTQILQNLIASRSDLKAVIERLQLPTSGKTLLIESETRLHNFPSAGRGTRDSLFIVRDTKKKSKAAPKKPAEDAGLVSGDVFSIELPHSTDLCLIALDLPQIPDVLEELIYARVFPILASGATVVAQFVRDASSKSLDKLGIKDVRQRAALQSFMQNQFGTLALGNIAPLKELFDRCSYFELSGWIGETSRDAAGDAVVWLVLRKRPGEPRAGAVQGFARTPRPDQFPLSELEMFFEAIKVRRIRMLPVDKFARAYKAYAAQVARGRRKRSRKFGHVKFDIHGNLPRALEIARMLNRLEIPGLFLMMQKHVLNADWYDSESTWTALREIRDLGHEIGLHIDVYDLIRNYGDLYEGLRAVLGKMRGHGLPVRAATFHGDSSPHIKAQRLHATDFFARSFRWSKWSGKPPVGEEFLAEHVGKYSLRKIWADLGIEYFSELNFSQRGRRLGRARLLYVSDNTRKLEISNIGKGTIKLGCAAPFRIDAEWVEKAAGLLAKRPFIALMHPQWYW